MTPQAIAELAASTLDENKAINIKSIDVTDNTDVTDFIVICTATSIRHAQALTDKVTRKLREHDIRAMSVEGIEQNDSKDGWVLVDFADIVVHVMLAEAREFYSLEKLWAFTEQTRQKSDGEN